MSFISYAEHLEDVMLWRLFKSRDNGFFIDVGLNNPHSHSVTRAFYEHGWRGVNISDDAAAVEWLREIRPDDINIQGKICVERERKDESVLLALNVILATYNRSIQFLQITDNFPEKILNNVSLKDHRPEVLLIKKRINAASIDFSPIDTLLASQHYQAVWFDGATNFYLANECSHYKSFFCCPPHRGDDFIRHPELRLQQSIQTLTQKFNVQDELLHAESESTEHLAAFTVGDEPSLTAAMQVNYQQRTERLLGILHSTQLLTDRRIDELLQQQHFVQQQCKFDLEQQRLYFDKEKQSLQEDFARQLSNSAEQLSDCLKKLSDCAAQRQCVEAELRGVYSGRVWRLTKPIRVMLDSVKPVIRKIREGGNAWLRLTPESRPRRVLRYLKKTLVEMIEVLIKKIKRYPRLWAFVQTILDKYPKVRFTFRRLLMAKPVIRSAHANAVLVNATLGKRAAYIYQRLQHQDSQFLK